MNRRFDTVRTAVLYNFLLEANVMASIAVILMIIVRRFFRPQLGSRAIRFAWVLVAARLLLPISLPNPFINDIRPGFLADAGIRPIAGQIKVRLQDALETVRWAIVSRSTNLQTALTEFAPPIIAMTTNVSENERTAALRAGMNAFCEKPVFIDELLATMSRYL